VQLARVQRVVDVVVDAAVLVLFARTAINRDDDWYCIDDGGASQKSRLDYCSQQQQPFSPRTMGYWQDSECTPPYHEEETHENQLPSRLAALGGERFVFRSPQARH